MPGKIKKEEQEKRCNAAHGQTVSFAECDFSKPWSGEFKQKFICTIHNHSFHLKARDFVRIDTPCERCRNAQKKQKCIDKHGDAFDYSITNFELPEAQPNQFICKKHNSSFQKTITDHVRFLSGGCDECESDWQSIRQAMSIEEFIQKATQLHGQKYDYSKVRQFKNQHELVLIGCDNPEHGYFLKSPANHLHKHLKQGCPECGHKRGTEKIRKSWENFLTDAKKVHGEKYEYEKGSFETTRSIIEIYCKECEIYFPQRVMDHLSGNGHPTCNREKGRQKLRKLNTEIVVRRCQEVWGNTYDYSRVKWERDSIPIEVGCLKGHGFFLIDFHNHTGLKRGCKKCGSTRRTKQNLWLDSIGIPDDLEHREATLKFPDGSWVFPDGMHREEKVVYEFWGDFWHGNPEKYNPDDYAHNGKTFGELYYGTQLKRERYKLFGFKLIEIWEADWDKQQSNRKPNNDA